MVLCPNEHDNLRGLSQCKVCGLPLLDLHAQFASLAERFVSRTEMGRPLPRSVFAGIGTAGANLIDMAIATRCRASDGCTYLAVDAAGSRPRPGTTGILRLALGGTDPTAATFCGIGEALARNDPTLLPVLRKAGVGRADSGQTLFLAAAIGGGIGSAASVFVEKSRLLNPECRAIGMVIVPGAEESFHNRLNAYYGLSRLLEPGESRSADMVVAIHYDRIRKIRGVGSDGAELRTEGMLVALSDLLVTGLSSENAAEMIRINRSMSVSLVVPCIAIGRSLEIFGGLGNILESAVAFPANYVSRRAVVVCHLLLRVPKNRAHDFNKERATEGLSALVKRHLPSVRGTSLSVTYSDEPHDRVDACILLGGGSATGVLFADEADLTHFQEEMARQPSWETYGLEARDIQRSTEVLARYDRTVAQHNLPSHQSRKEGH